MASDSGFKFLPQGALIQEIRVGGHNVVLGFPDPEPYQDSPFFGETIGRVANRIEDGRMSLNGKTYQLETNNGPNHLHGGTGGWVSIFHTCMSSMSGCHTLDLFVEQHFRWYAGSISFRSFHRYRLLLDPTSLTFGKG